MVPVPRGAHPQVYTGGIGSYALITMVAAFLQLHSSRRPAASAATQQQGAKGGGSAGKGRQQGQGPRGGGEQGVKASLLEPSLGVLLVDFFRFYGRVINTHDVRAMWRGVDADGDLLGMGRGHVSKSGSTVTGHHLSLSIFTASPPDPPPAKCSSRPPLRSAASPEYWVMRRS